MAKGFGAAKIDTPSSGLKAKFIERWTSIQRSMGEHRTYRIELTGYSISELRQLCNDLALKHPQYRFAVLQRLDSIRFRGVEVSSIVPTSCS